MTLRSVAVAAAVTVVVVALTVGALAWYADRWLSGATRPVPWAEVKV